MGLCKTTIELLKEYLPGRVLSLGYPQGSPKGFWIDSILTIVDIIPHLGIEQIADLSSPQDLGQYEVVLDHGTIEHCSNPAMAFINVARAVALNGVAFHHTPVSMMNHGWWNVNPTWFLDFYTSNGFSIEYFEITDNRGQIINLTEPLIKLGACIPMECLVLCIARRVKLQKIVLPKIEAKWDEQGLALKCLQTLRKIRFKYNV